MPTEGDQRFLLMLLTLIATPLFSGVCDISLLSMQLDQDFQLGISMKNVIQHMYTVNLYR